MYSFSALTEFKRVHGHCNVPKRWSKNPKLGYWVVAQRQEMKKGLLSEERIQLLNEIGFEWDLQDPIWEEMFLALAEFIKIHGHCNVPGDWPENPQLSNWVSAQRRLWKEGQLNQNHIRRLNKMGFEWDLQDAIWSEMFLALVDFKKVAGDFRVPSYWPEKPQLRKWVSTQRELWKKGVLSRDRVRRLEKIGLPW